MKPMLTEEAKKRMPPDKSDPGQNFAQGVAAGKTRKAFARSDINHSITAFKGGEHNGSQKFDRIRKP